MESSLVEDQFEDHQTINEEGPKDQEVLDLEVVESVSIPKYKDDELVSVSNDAASALTKIEVKGEKTAKSFKRKITQMKLDAKTKKMAVDRLKLQTEITKSDLKVELRDRYAVDKESKRLQEHLEDLVQRASAVVGPIDDLRNVIESSAMKREELLQKSRKFDEQYHFDKENYTNLYEIQKERFESRVASRKEQLHKKKEILKSLRGKITKEKLATSEMLKLMMQEKQTIYDEHKKQYDELAGAVDTAFDEDMLKSASKQLEDLKQIYANAQEEGLNYTTANAELSRAAEKDRMLLDIEITTRHFLQEQLDTLRSRNGELQHSKLRLTQLKGAKSEYLLEHEKHQATLARLELDRQQYKNTADERLASNMKLNFERLASHEHRLAESESRAENTKKSVEELRGRYKEISAKSDSIHNTYRDLLSKIDELKKKKATGPPKSPLHGNAGPSGGKTGEPMGILKKTGVPSSNKKVTFSANQSATDDSEPESIDAFLTSLFKGKLFSGVAKPDDEIFDNLLTSPPEKD